MQSALITLTTITLSQRALSVIGVLKINADCMITGKRGGGAAPPQR